MIKIFTDGGARGNPGKAAIGVHIEKEGETLFDLGQKIGETTNNVAEYSAVIAGLEWLVKNNTDNRIDFYLDSELVCRQINGTYRVKNLKLSQLMSVIRTKEAQIKGQISYHHIRREKNEKADFLVNAALDNLL